MAKIKKKKRIESSDEGLSAREKMMARKKKLSEKGKGGITFIKEGTIRVRFRNPGPDEELAIEIIQFYLGAELGGVISPATFNEPCPIMEKYEELKASDDEDDILWASKLVPKRRYLASAIVYADPKGKKVDKPNSLIMLPSGLYDNIIDLYLDEEDWGDMTDGREGYDTKLIRSGKGKNDTNYSVNPCPKSAIKDKELRKPVDLKEMVSAVIPSYEDCEEKLNKFLKGSVSDDDDAPVKKKISSKKKKKSRDI